MTIIGELVGWMPPVLVHVHILIRSATLPALGYMRETDYKPEPDHIRALPARNLPITAVQRKVSLLPLNRRPGASHHTAPPEFDAPGRILPSYLKHITVRC